MSFHDDEEENFTVVLKPKLLSTTDLIDEYETLSAKYLESKKQIDAFEQMVYGLKRKEELGVARETALTDELQSITDAHNDELEQVKRKYSLEMDEMRNRLNDEKLVKEHLESEIERLNNELALANKRLAEKSATETKPLDPNEVIVSIHRLEFLEQLEAAQEKRIGECAELNSQIGQLRLDLKRVKADYENMEECYECAKQNSNHKNEEIENLQQMNEALQEQNAGLSMQLASFQNGRDDHNKKGNSLFAEVDDQRQQMREVLSRQKDKYLWMKKRYEDGEKEIRRLKRENADIHDEVKACANMFRTKESNDHQWLVNRVGFLARENERLTEKLTWTEKRLQQTAKEHGVNWLDSMLEYCRDETEKLKIEVQMDGMRACDAEHTASQAQERAVQWRFEALKSRCIIIDREFLLEENGIKFDPSLKNMRAIVKSRFGDGSKEQPNIDYEENLLSNGSNRNQRKNGNVLDTTSDVNTTSCENLPVVVVERYVVNQNKSIGENSPGIDEFNGTQRSLQEEMGISNASISSSGLGDHSSITLQNVESNVSLENKENVNNGNSLASEFGMVGTLTEMNISSMVKQELKQSTSEITPSTVNASIASTSGNVSMSAPTPPTRVKQVSKRKLQIKIGNIIDRRNE